MKSIICFTALLGLAWSVPNYWEDKAFVSRESSEDGQGVGSKLTNCSCGWTNKGRIVGGRETLVNEYPLMAGLVSAEDQLLFCGASIITPHHALSAVHCTIEYKGQKIYLAVGEHNLLSNKEKEAALYPIDRTIVHEDYNDMTLANDIALVVVKRKIEFSQRIGPVCLPNKMLNLVNEHVKVLGKFLYIKYLYILLTWALFHNKVGDLTTDQGSQSSVLMKVNLKVISTAECYKSHPIDIRSPKAKNVICTYRDNKDSCEGDSGGPVIWLDPETNRFTLVGLVSHGRMCAGDSPAINVNVGNFLPWIQQKIASTGLIEKTCAKTNKK
ncbi:venom serine protease-like [Halyomorpha halys]|uniref:venom serine protease-like n=1 Tax=Halyomorpha halys TaxID=286706 RepID=UPI0034D1D24F